MFSAIADRTDRAMEFRLDGEQRELQDTLRRFCAARFPSERIAQREANVDRSAWREMAELGVFGVFAPGACGDPGVGMVEGAIVFEQLGAHLVSGPALWSTLGARWVAGAAGGERLVGGVERIAPDGEPMLVEHGAEIDALLVLRDDGVFVCAGRDLPAFEPVAPLDPLTPVGR